MSLRIERRVQASWAAELIVILAAVALAAVAGCGIFALAGAPPLEALWVLVQEPFGSAYGLSETLVRTVPLALCALAVALALKIDLWNIGAEGQLYLGALAGSWLALHGPDLPGPLRLPAILLVGAAAGAVWAVIPGLLKVYGRVNEIISTLMLNYVAIAWVKLMVYGPWKGADGFPYTTTFDASWWLPLLYKRVHGGLVLVLALAAALWLIERRTVLGFEVRVAGASQVVARYAGVPVLSRLLLVMAVAGAAAGLAGVCEVAGVEHRLHAAISPGYGYTAIIIAFLARRSLPLSVLVAFLFAGLAVGGDGLQVSFPGVSSAVVQVFQGLLLLLVLAGGWLPRYRVGRREGGGA